MWQSCTWYTLSLKTNTFLIKLQFRPALNKSKMCYFLISLHQVVCVWWFLSWSCITVNLLFQSPVFRLARFTSANVGLNLLKLCGKEIYNFSYLNCSWSMLLWWNILLLRQIVDTYCRVILAAEFSVAF